jgi:predicted DNA-binding transcriptional regulator YafY
MNQHKIYRVLRLMQLLQAKPRTVRSMARYLGTSERTAYRYIQLFMKLEMQVKRDQFNKYFIEQK